MKARLPIIQTATASTGGSSFSPLATMSSIPSGNGRCGFSASTVSPSSQRSNSSVVVMITGMALGWMGATTALASVVRNPNSSCSPSTRALFGPRTPRQGVHNPAKANSGRSALRANQVGVLRGVVGAYSQNDVAGTRQRFLAESQPRQCGLETLRMLVTGWPPNCSGPGMPQRAMNQFALTIRAVAHDRRELVREDPGEGREVAGPVVGGAEQGADGGLAFGETVEVAHAVEDYVL